MDIEKSAKAIEADAGGALPELRQALRESAAIIKAMRAGTAAPGRVTTPEQSLVRAARDRLGMTQAEFASRIGTPVATLRDWEQGRFTPPGAALALLRLLAAHPKLAKELAA